MDEILSDAVDRLFSDHAMPRQIRAIEQNGDAGPLWTEIERMGIADALVSEAKGGAGLGLMDVFGVLTACGGYALPVPLALTMFVRPLLAEHGLDVPCEPISIAPSSRLGAAGSLDCWRVPYGRVAKYVLAEVDGAWCLLSVRDGRLSPTGVHASLEADIGWSAAALEAPRLVPRVDIKANAACLMAAQIAGALETILERTVSYANERVQFGRPIGRFQAIQQQIAVMAENVFAARMAAEMGCASRAHAADPLRAAVAKLRASEAVIPVAAIAHAVHGAIGITAEFDLQLFTRRLHEWRAAYGTESHWSLKLGEALFKEEAGGSLDFIRARLFPAAT